MLAGILIAGLLLLILALKIAKGIIRILLIIIVLIFIAGGSIFSSHEAPPAATSDL